MLLHQPFTHVTHTDILNIIIMIYYAIQQPQPKNICNQYNATLYSPEVQFKT